MFLSKRVPRRALLRSWEPLNIQTVHFCKRLYINVCVFHVFCPWKLCCLWPQWRTDCSKQLFWRFFESIQNGTIGERFISVSWNLTLEGQMGKNSGFCKVSSVYVLECNSTLIIVSITFSCLRLSTGSGSNTDTYWWKKGYHSLSHKHAHWLTLSLTDTLTDTNTHSRSHSLMLSLTHSDTLTLSLTL